MDGLEKAVASWDVSFAWLLPLAIPIKKIHINLYYYYIKHM